MLSSLYQLIQSVFFKSYLKHEKECSFWWWSLLFNGIFHLPGEVSQGEAENLNLESWVNVQYRRERNEM